MQFFSSPSQVIIQSDLHGVREVSTVMCDFGSFFLFSYAANSAACSSSHSNSNDSSSEELESLVIVLLASSSVSSFSVPLLESR